MTASQIASHKHRAKKQALKYAEDSLHPSGYVQTCSTGWLMFSLDTTNKDSATRNKGIFNFKFVKDQGKITLTSII